MSYYIRDRQLPNPTLTPRTQGEPMTAKAIVTIQPPPQRTYPWVGIHPIGTIVWFTHPNQGVVIGRDLAHYNSSFGADIGSTTYKWTVEDFKEFTGTVTISN